MISKIFFFSAFGRRLAGYGSLDELYEKSSCSLYMDNISVPFVMMNAQDDPIIPDHLFSIPQQYAGWCWINLYTCSLFQSFFSNMKIENRDKSAFILTTHGGHLGYYEGGLIKPNCVTWWVELLAYQYSDTVLTECVFFCSRLDRTAVGIADAFLRDNTHSKSL